MVSGEETRAPVADNWVVGNSRSGGVASIGAVAAIALPLPQIPQHAYKNAQVTPRTDCHSPVFSQPPRAGGRHNPAPRNARAQPRQVLPGAQQHAEVPQGQPAQLACAVPRGRSKSPTTAVTLLVGDIRSARDSVMPRARCASSAARRTGWGRKRQVAVAPARSASRRRAPREAASATTLASAASAARSTAAVPAASKTTCASGSVSERRLSSALDPPSPPSRRARPPPRRRPGARRWSGREARARSPRAR